MSYTYTTKQGDMWDSIAFNELGSTRYTDILMRSNMKYHTAYIFSAGIELTIPDVSDTFTNDDMPPWKKVSG